MSEELLKIQIRRVEALIKLGGFKSANSLAVSANVDPGTISRKLKGTNTNCFTALTMWKLEKAAGVRLQESLFSLLDPAAFTAALTSTISLYETTNKKLQEDPDGLVAHLNILYDAEIKRRDENPSTAIKPKVVGS